MNVLAFGIDFKHKKGEFCDRAIARSYFISLFRTDYMIELDGCLTRGRAGDMYICRPGDIVYHGSAPDGDVGFSNDWVYVEGDDFSELLERYPLPIGKLFRVDGSLYLSAALEKIHRERAYADVGYREKCSIIMTEAIIDIYRSYIKGEKLSAEARLEYVRGRVMRDYRRNWKLSDMAKLSGYSESRFSSLYKEIYGTSPINDLIARRIEEAKLLILYGNTSLSEIAEITGFSSIYYFSRHFKKIEGISPLQFKIRQKKL